MSVNRYLNGGNTVPKITGDLIQPVIMDAYNSGTTVTEAVGFEVTSPSSASAAVTVGRSFAGNFIGNTRVTDSLLVGGSGAISNSSTSLDLQSTTQALKLNSSPRGSISTPLSGMITNDSNTPYFYNGTAWVSLLSGGITNSAANNELMVSNGTNAIGRKIFSSSNGNLTLGDNTFTGDRTIQSNNSTTNSRLILQSELNVQIRPTASTIWLFTSNSFISPNSGFSVSNDNNTGAGFLVDVGGTAGRLTIGGTTGPTTSVITGNSGLFAGSVNNLDVRTANSQNNNNVGSLNLYTGVPNGTGLEGAVNVQTRSTGRLSFFGVTPVVRQSAVTSAQGIADALTAYGLLPTSTISGGGASLPTVNTVSTSTTLSISGTSQIVRGNLSSAITSTLPTAVGNAGYIFHFKKVDNTAFAWTIDADGSETIDGDTDVIVNGRWTMFSIYSNGTNWEII